VSIPLTKWGMRWQNERYIRSAQNQDDIDIVKERLDAIEERINKLEEK
jgi:tetrahydromethanopterin S-methyltransferase subunit G